MELKQNLTLEVKKGDYTFVFHMPNGASWGNALDVSFDILQHINKLAQNSAQAMRNNEEPVVVQEGE